MLLLPSAAPRKKKERPQCRPSFPILSLSTIPTRIGNFSYFHVNPLFFSNLVPLITPLAARGNEGAHCKRPSLAAPILIKPWPFHVDSPAQDPLSLFLFSLVIIALSLARMSTAYTAITSSKLVPLFHYYYHYDDYYYSVLKHWLQKKKKTMAPRRNSRSTLFLGSG